MSSFQAITCYNPLMVLLLGIVTFLGWTGSGMAIIKLLRLSFATPWQQVAGALLGIQLTSLSVQLTAMAGWAYPLVLITIWCAITLAGLIFILSTSRIPHLHFPSISTLGCSSFSCFLVPLLLFIALLTSLLAAMAPSSKIDELYYHMILPSRIVSDNALLLYRFPWESAVWPHMIFQMALSPLHAIKYPDAGNVASWSLHAMLIWFAWHLIKSKGTIKPWGWLMLLCLSSGIYPVIWDVTGGGYPMGEIATATLVVLLLSEQKLIENTGFGPFILLFSFLVMCMASTKILMLPLAGTLMVILGIKALSKDFTIFRLGSFLLSAILPWALFYIPILVWTMYKTGSPFGPVMAGFLHSNTVFDVEQLKSIFEIDRVKNSVTLYDIFFNSAIYYPALLWIGVFYFLFAGKINSVIRITALFLVVFHGVVLQLMVIFDTRYYSGIFQGFILLLIPVLASLPRNHVLNRKWAMTTVTLCLLVPWLFLQIFFGKQFFPVSLGLQDKQIFYRDKIAFYDDYLKIDKLLPTDATIFYKGDNTVRLNSVYVPRPLYFRFNDLPTGVKPYLLTVNLPKPGTVGNFTTDTLIYQNKRAITITYRNPFRGPDHGDICVYKLK